MIKRSRVTTLRSFLFGHNAKAHSRCIPTVRFITNIQRRLGTPFNRRHSRGHHWRQRLSFPSFRQRSYLYPVRILVKTALNRRTKRSGKAKLPLNPIHATKENATREYLTVACRFYFVHSTCPDYRFSKMWSYLVCGPIKNNKSVSGSPSASTAKAR